MSLSPDALEFQQKVAKAPISGNIDNPEGGFDALVQVFPIFLKVLATCFHEFRIYQSTIFFTIFFFTYFLLKQDRVLLLR
jgi:hypothetical protein